MKLAMVLMLVALPIYCSAGSGCSYLERVISDTSDSSVTADVYLASLQEYISSDDTTQAIKELRECFLKQSEETLENFSVFMQVTYNSKLCAAF
uniref:Uncharacterized protein n=1 Tax=Sus scrofa TaxID=9823 RepID=A0A8D1ZKP1_PIG